MKRIALNALVFLGFGLLFASCSKEIAESDYASAIVGQWQMTKEETYVDGKLKESEPAGDYVYCVTYNENGEFIYEENGEIDDVGRYKVNGNTLTIYLDGTIPYKNDIIRLTKTELVLGDEDSFAKYWMYFKRIK